MRILFYAAHPAQYLFFRQTIRNLLENNHQVKLLIKTKEVLEQLVLNDGLDYENILAEGRSGSRAGLIIALLKRNLRLLKIVRRFKPDIMLGTDASISQVGWLKNIPSVTCLEDDYSVIKNLANLSFPFTKYILAPEVCKVGNYNHKKLAYNGLMKLAYLHPEYFKHNIELVKKYIGNEEFCLIRLSALKAHHDTHISGISKTTLVKLLSLLEKNFKIYISSEEPLSEEFEKYRLNINPSHIHHFLKSAKILISDSQSMSVEAAILGTPSIRISSFKGRISVLEELEERYNLTFGVKPENEKQIFKLLNTILNTDTDTWKKRNSMLLKEKIDVSALLTWLILEYPKSAERLQKDPSLQYSLK